MLAVAWSLVPSFHGLLHASPPQLDSHGSRIDRGSSNTASVRTAGPAVTAQSPRSQSLPLSLDPLPSGRLPSWVTFVRMRFAPDSGDWHQEPHVCHNWLSLME